MLIAAAPRLVRVRARLVSSVAQRPSADPACRIRSAAAPVRVLPQTARKLVQTFLAFPDDDQTLLRSLSPGFCARSGQPEGHPPLRPADPIGRTTMNDEPRHVRPRRLTARLAVDGDERPARGRTSSIATNNERRARARACDGEVANARTRTTLLPDTAGANSSLEARACPRQSNGRAYRRRTGFPSMLACPRRMPPSPD